MRPLFVRLGNKYKLREYIINKFPESFDLYCEPFAGSASIFFSLEDFHGKVVLNDLDKDLISAYKLIKRVDKGKLPILHTKEAMYKLIEHPTTNEEKLMAYIYRTSNSFMSSDKGYLWKDSSQESKVANIEKYQERLRGVKFLNRDGLSVIREYDSKHSFFFIDPPYQKSDDLYKHDEFNLEDLRDVLKTLKGKFLLTLNDSKSVRDLFSMFKITGYVVKSHSNLGRIAGSDRREVVIRNF